MTAEEFLRNKLENEIGYFGDGNTEFHTRDLEHLLKCMDDKDEIIRQNERHRIDLTNKINFNVEKQFLELLESVMTRNNLSAEERLRCIRNHYKEVWDKIKPLS